MCTTINSLKQHNITIQMISESIAKLRINQKKSLSIMWERYCVDQHIPNTITELVPIPIPSSSHTQNIECVDENDVKYEDDDEFMRKVQHVIENENDGINQIIHHLIDKKELLVAKKQDITFSSDNTDYK